MHRDQALNLVKEWTSSPSLIKHMLCVESAMRGLAKHFNQDEELWGMAGLLHDLDYEKLKDTPQLHPSLVYEELAKYPIDERIVQAIKAHAWQHQVDAPQPNSLLEWALFTCDELTGLIVACALVTPSKKLSDVTTESVIRKFPKKDFAKGVDRARFDLIEPNLGLTVTEFVAICLQSLQGISSTLEL